jgi:16S rRNA G966 N2-methylase RsmD
VESWLPTAPAESFDLIFLDPPYDQTPEELSTWNMTTGLDRLLTPKGRIVWEHSHRVKWSAETPLKEVWRREYGQTCVSFLAH